MAVQEYAGALPRADPMAIPFHRAISRGEARTARSYAQDRM